MNTQLTAVQHPQGNAIDVRRTFGIEGLENLGARDVIVPRWSIVQPTSQREGADQHIGQFVRNLDLEYRPVLDVVILQVSPSRLLWGDENGAQRSLECTSRDGQTGSKYGDCVRCSFNRDVNLQLAQALRNGEPLKACNYGYTVLLIDDAEAETLALLGAMSTSVRPLKILVSQFVQKRRPPFSALVRFATEQQKNERGKYYVLKPTIKQWLDEAGTARWRARWQELQVIAIHEVEETEGAGPNGPTSTLDNAPTEEPPLPEAPDAPPF